MKTLRILMILFGAGLISGLLSCNTEKNLAPEALTLDVKVTDLSPESAQVTIAPSHNESTYYWSVRPMEEYDSFESVDKLQEADLADLREAASLAGQDFSDYLQTVLCCAPVSEKVDGLKPEMSYCAYAYEMNSEGVVASDVALARFTTPKEPCHVKLEIPECGMTWIEVESVPENDEIRYYFDQMPESLYQSYGGTDEGAARYFRESLEYTAENRGQTIEQIVAAISIFGENYRRIEGLQLDTDYRIYVVEIDEAGNVTNVTTVAASTTERQMSDLSVEINIKSLNSYKAEIEFVPSNNSEEYVFQMWPLEEYEAMVSESETGDFRDYAVETWGTKLMRTMGTYVATGKDLVPEAEYIIIAFGYQDGTWVTELFSKNITIPAAGPATDLQVDIDITNTASHYSEAVFTPSDETVSYMFHYMTEEQYKAFGNDTTISVQTYVNAYLAAYMEEYPEYTKEQLIQALSVRSKRQSQFRYLQPSTKHYVWAVSVDKDGQLASRPALKEFTTLDYIVAESCIVKDATYRYWDGDVMAEHMPMFSNFQGEVGAVVDAIAVEGSDTWIGYFYKDDLTDKTEYPDSYIASNLFFTGKKDLAGPNSGITIFHLEWGTWTLCIVALDDEGNFGPVYRKCVDFVKDGVSPIEEFPRYDDFHPKNVAPAASIQPNNTKIEVMGNLPPLDLSIINQPMRRSTVEPRGPVFEIEQSEPEVDEPASLLMSRK